MRIGVLGGTFDPVHNGHLIIAQEARISLCLDRVLFVPAGRPWFKDGDDVTAMDGRLEMLRLAVNGNPYFGVDTRELERKGPTYTVDTMAELRDELGPTGEIFFIIGLDALLDLGRWKEPRRLASLCRFATMRRPGYTDLDFRVLDDVPGVSDRVHLLDNIQIDISSSAIRCRVRRGLPITYLVPGPVEKYILAHGLYRDPSG